MKCRRGEFYSGNRSPNKAFEEEFFFFSFSLQKMHDKENAFVQHISKSSQFFFFRISVKFRNSSGHHVDASNECGGPNFGIFHLLNK